MGIFTPLSTQLAGQISMAASIPFGHVPETFSFSFEHHDTWAPLPLQCTRFEGLVPGETHCICHALP